MHTVTAKQAVVGRLTAIEEEARTLIDGSGSHRLRLCRLLSELEGCKLYRAIGVQNFKEYLKTGRIPIAYQTAQQYASIGHIIKAEADLLDSIDFRETDGLCKLRLLAAALERHSNRAEVARHLKQDSYRAFRVYAYSDDFADQPVNAQLSGGLDISWSRVYFDDDTIRVRTEDGEDRELVWFNPDAYDSKEQYEEFVAMVMALVQRSGGVKWPVLRACQTRVS
jgi:hypothetical protein